MKTGSIRQRIWRQRFRFARTPLLLLLLAGCSSEPTMRLYLLSPAPEFQIASDPRVTAPALQVQRVLIPDYLDTTDILVRIGPHEVKASSTGQWAERLSAGIAHALRADLARLLPQDRIIAGGPADTAAAQIIVTIDALDMAAAGRCSLVAHWTAGSRKGQGRFEAVSDIKAGDEAWVDTLAGLIAQLAASIGGMQKTGFT